MATRSETLKQIIKVEGIREANRDIGSLKGSIDTSSESLVRMGLKFVSVGLAVKTLTDSYKTFIVQRDAIKGVELAIRNMGVGASLSVDEVSKLSSEIQAITNYGDEFTQKEIFRPLINSGIKTVDVLKLIGMTIIDVADGTGQGVESISRQINDLVSGASTQVMQLAKATGIAQADLKRALAGTSTATERAIALAETLGSKFEGSAGEMVDPMKQLSNTLGDLKEEVGRAFYPIIKTLADSATGFLSNEKNVERLITSVKALTMGFGALQLAKVGLTITSQVNSIRDRFKALGEVRQKMDELFQVLRVYHNQVQYFENSMRGMTKGTKGYITAQESYARMLEMIGEGERNANDAQEKGLRIMRDAKVGMASLSLSMLNWVGVALTVVTVGYQLGKSFGWWGKKVEDANKILEENKKKELERRDVYKQSLQSTKDLLEINNRTVAENKELSRYIAILKDNYGLLIPIEGERAKVLKKINEELETQKSFSIGIGSPKGQIEQQIKDLERGMRDSQAIMDKYASSDRYKVTFLDDAKGWFTSSSGYRTLTKHGEIYVANKKKVKDLQIQIAELNDQLGLLGKGKSGSREMDTSVLAKYYDIVKFEDSSYMNWKKKMNEKASQEYKDSLTAEGYTVEQAEAHRLQYRGVINDQLLKEHRTWLEGLEALSRSYAPSMEYPDDVVWDVTEYENILKKRESDLASYYSSVGSLDKTYYDWKIEQIRKEANELQISEDKRALYVQNKINDLDRESEAYQNYESIVNTAINSISNTMLSYIKITTRSSGVIKNVFVNLANAVIAEIGRIITKMLAMFAVERLLGAFSFGSRIGSGGGLPLGTGEGLSGFIASSPSSIGSNLPSTIVQPTSGGIRGNSNDIVNKLNEVISAINNNSIKGKIRTIDIVDLAKEVDRGNRQWSVL